MKKILVSFATNQKWYRAQSILNATAKRGGFSGCISYTDTGREWAFAKKYQDVYQTRGFGFWQWKPLIILDALEKVDDGDIVGYVDSGNSILNNLEYVFNKCCEQNIVLFDNRDGNSTGQVHLNKTWTKRDCFTLMNCDEEKYYSGAQVDASYQFYRKTPSTITFLTQYRDYCSNENIVSDIPNITGENFPEFKDHRHDQSVLSLLAIKHDVKLLPEPSEWGNHLNRPYSQLFLHHRGTV